MDVLAVLVLDVEIHPAARVLGDELRQSNRPAQEESPTAKPGCIHPGIVAAGEPNDEASTGISRPVAGDRLVRLFGEAVEHCADAIEHCVDFGELDG